MFALNKCLPNRKFLGKYAAAHRKLILIAAWPTKNKDFPPHPQ
jgi:hypothetical protein